MFLDLWLKFCCSQRQKPEGPDPQMPQEYYAESGPTTTAEQRALISSSQELRQKISQQQMDRKPFNSKQNIKTSLEMEMEPVDGFLALSDNKSNKIASWEILEQQRQVEVLNQLTGLSILAQSFASNNNGSFHQSQLSNSGNQNGCIYGKPDLTQTIHLPIIDEFPKKQLQRYSSTSFSAIEKKKIIKEKKQKTEKKQVTKEKQSKLWDKTEDDILRTAYHEFNGNWRQIALKLPGRNMNQCSQRWRRLNPQTQNKKKWTFDDDIKIKQLVQQMGKNWAEIAKHFEGKSGKQVRERFLNKLDPAINLDQWTIEEDEIILTVFKESGPKWSIASKRLNGRPENMVKNRFYSYIRRVVLGQQNPYSVVLNDKHRDMLNEQSQDSESHKAPNSMDQTPSFTGSSMLSSYMDEDYMEDGIMEDQFKI